MDTYQVVEVPPEHQVGSEPMGSKRKFWCVLDGRRYLFKYRRADTGEDWAEKLAAEIAEVLGVPRALVELAVCGDARGTITLNLVGEGGTLVHGNELLQQRAPGYPAGVTYRAAFHTVDAVLQVLRQDFVRPPIGACLPGIISAPDWFCGYLLLDALIGNTDRHHENWAVLESRDATGRLASLAPSYDHASSLGRELGEDIRSKRLETRDASYTVAAYAQRTRSALYRSADDRKPLSPADAFAEATKGAAEVRTVWLSRLERLDHSVLTELVGRVPDDRMSELARRFALELLSLNRAALLGLQGG